jgi:metal-responsive CopG/Arc/MetJ family transcriptional regulator
LSFKHHAEVLSIEDAHLQDRFLDWCEEILSLNGKPRSTRELRQAVREYLDEQGWSEDESARRERAKADITVVAN